VERGITLFAEIDHARNDSARLAAAFDVEDVAAGIMGLPGLVAAVAGPD
jgi:hypothetical protein